MRTAIVLVSIASSLAGTTAAAVDASLDAPAAVPAGSSFQVRWSGPGAPTDFISVDAPNAADNDYGHYAYARGNPVEIAAPDQPGAYVLRYHVGSGYAVVATRALTVTDVSASVRVSPTVLLGGDVVVEWTGPKQKGDFISIDVAGAADAAYGPYAYAQANPAKIRAPETAGDYLVRYHMGGSGYRVIASAPLKVSETVAELSAPDHVDARSDILVQWTGPGHPNDFVSIDRAGSDDRTYGDYATATKSPLTLRAPDASGDYLVRYHLAGSYRVIGAVPVRIGAIEASLTAVDSVKAGAYVDVSFTGPAHARDFISIDAVGAPERTYGNFAYVRGAGVRVRAPDLPGAYALRYHTGATYSVIGVRTLRVDPVTASLTAPAEAVAGSIVAVTWDGPDNDGDFVTLVSPDAPPRQYGSSNGYTRRGNPVRLEVPHEAGIYELRYLTGQSYATLATAQLSVVAGAATGSLRVVGAPQQRNSAPSNSYSMHRGACCRSSAASVASTSQKVRSSASPTRSPPVPHSGSGSLATKTRMRAEPTSRSRSPSSTKRRQLRRSRPLVR